MSEPSAESDSLFAGVSDENLRYSAEGCTELTCFYHGRINRELSRRATNASVAAEPWDASRDLYIERPDVPGHAMTSSAAGPSFVIGCECGWTSDPLHLSNLCAARNRHRIEAAS